MGRVEPIDLQHQATERVIGVYLLDTADGPALFDCGPSTCIGALKEGLAGRGLALTDVRHLLLSHIHLDHAGAAGSLVREHPGLQVHVSAVGARHLVDPSRLEDVDGDDSRTALVQEIERLDAHRRRSKQNERAGRLDRGRRHGRSWAFARPWRRLR